MPAPFVITITMTACSKQKESSILSLDFDEIIIEYYISQDEKEEVTITDNIVLDELSKVYDSMSTSTKETSEPMGFPRFLIKFQKDGSFVVDWSIDNNKIISGDQLGLGNREIKGDESIYDYIDEVFSSAIDN